MMFMNLPCSPALFWRRWNVVAAVIKRRLHGLSRSGSPAGPVRTGFLTRKSRVVSASGLQNSRPLLNRNAVCCKRWAPAIFRRYASCYCRLTIRKFTTLKLAFVTYTPLAASRDGIRGSFDFTASEVEEAIRSFPVGSSGGPSDLRPTLLLELLSSTYKQELLEALAAFCSPFVNGHFMPDSMRVLTAARLVAIGKPVLLQVDLRNAFNSLDRSAMLAEVQARPPLLYPYALSCYQQPTLPYGDGHSTSGVQQGNVSGPALFALALHRVVLQLQELGLHYQFWFLDDGIICGPATQSRPSRVDAAALSSWSPH